MRLRARIVAVHRWASLAAMAFWLVQAATGLFTVFHWEIDDATVRGEERPLDLDAIERTAASLAPPGSGRRVDSIWTSAGSANRFDIAVEATPPALGCTVRVDGAGEILRRRRDDEWWSDGGLADTLVRLHQSLLAGSSGKPIVGASGLLLLSNLGLGIAAAWPRAGRWRGAFFPAPRSAGAARLYNWHRALGLWLALPAAGLVAAGVLLAFEATTERLVGAGEIEAPTASALPTPSAPPVGAAAAVRAALARFPAAALSGIDFPKADRALWEIRLRQPSEPRRAYGKTRVWVSAVDGTAAGDLDALRSPPARRFVDTLFSIHTGEALGLAGRLLAFALAGWLLAMNVLGFRLWRERRRLRATTRRPA